MARGAPAGSEECRPLRTRPLLAERSAALPHPLQHSKVPDAPLEAPPAPPLLQEDVETGMSDLEDEVEQKA